MRSAGLLEAYADLQHASVAVPELLAAVGDQVRRGAAVQHAQAAALGLAATPAPAATPPAAAPGLGAPQQQQQQQQRQQGSPVPLPAAPAAAAGAAPPGGPPSDGFSLAHISSLVESHLRLGYRPPPLLLQCLGPQIVHQLPNCPAEDAAALLQVLAAANCSPGSKVVQLLLGRAMDGTAGNCGVNSGSGALIAPCGSNAASNAAQRAADTLLASRPADAPP